MEKHCIKEYPGYPEYKLIDMYPVEKIHYRRGNSFDNFFSPDFELWQEYFANEYVVDEKYDTLLFHSCSWAKPYDFSHVIQPIRDVVKKYDNVHRIILSNVGVVPYEYQMNPTFCTYDFPPIYDTVGMEDEEIKELRKKIVEVNYNRIYRYLESHKNDYKKVVTYLIPLQYGMCHIVALICKELNIPYENVISKTLYEKYKNKKYVDSGELFRESELLEALDKVLAGGK